MESERDREKARKIGREKEREIESARRGAADACTGRYDAAAAYASRLQHHFYHPHSQSSPFSLPLGRGNSVYPIHIAISTGVAARLVKKLIATASLCAAGEDIARYNDILVRHGR